jgi:glyceraldehyde 3-phosphate dehydrogenase
VTVTEVNEALKAAAEGDLKGIMGFCELPLVSTDFNGSNLSSIVDSGTTYVVDQMVKVLSWYDNESGYSHRMIDLAALVGSTL